MAETLLSISEVLLYGRAMEDIQFTYQRPSTVPPDQGPDCDPPRPGIEIGGNAQFERQLAADPNGDFAPRFARVYGFSFEGCYYDLDAPIIMLVHGPGTVAERLAADQRAARGPESPDRSGSAAQGHSFAEEIRVWSYDKGDFSVRMDSLTGTIEDILLDIELGHGVGSVSGGRVSGGRVSGGRVAGGRVSGGRVSGGRVSGGRVSGGKDD
ncbi:MAG: hypothetical protein ACR2QW_07315 [bacterium]